MTDGTPSVRARPSLGRMASRTAMRTATPLGRSLEIGDLVRLEGSDLVGVLRYTGAVHGRTGTYAGLELIGDSTGRGKNDGTIDGVQYFATTPLNGIFGPLSRVIPISDARPQSATARPRSALSRSSSRADTHDRPPSAIGRPPSSVARPPSSIARPPSRGNATPTRPTSARAMRPPSTPNTHMETRPRTMPRRSIAVPTSTPGRRPASPEKRSTTPVRRPPSSHRGHLASSMDERVMYNDAFSSGQRTTPKAALSHKELLEQMDLAPKSETKLPDASPELAALDADADVDALDDVSVDAGSGAGSGAGAHGLFDAQERQRELDKEALDALRLELADERRRRRDAAQREAALAANAADAEKRATQAEEASAAFEQKAAALEKEKTESTSRIHDLEAALEAASLRSDPAPSDESGVAGELAQLHAKIEQMIAAWNRERAELTGRIDDLTNAGRETINVYEAQLAAGVAEQDALKARIAELEARDPGAGIDAASAQEHAEHAAHLQRKVERLEEELMEARTRVEAYSSAEKRDTVARAGVEERLRAEVLKLQTQLRAAEDRVEESSARADALQVALDESSAALERERAELESLRAERLGSAVSVPASTPQVPAAAPDAASASPNPAVDELKARIAALERENATQKDQFQRDIGELEALVEARIFKEEELENEMERLRRERDEALAGR
ncbi:hypothetical protein MCUN1_003402 [Malassezia cuniculi]|uniref:CAP-Gly domain-containing protein n=1 Tax=Malassezia cuniculi TaxID=948313 RepID=A0AAF0EWP5_9BASI|nr:hypothetical protein MCUN1_003402 [Malassezia cuniculi]